MLPIRLKIHGINSYQKEQVIEFDELLSDKIFGIFGEVGSGKSTILDAISFALYGKMEKMNKSDGVNYNMMNLKSNSFLIEYDFVVDNNEKYRFVVKGKRNSKNFDDVKLIKSGYKWSENKWLPIEDFNPEKKAEEIIGLSYDNFKRTIIIPQGKFMDFIQLKDADRTKMLKEIFNLQKYDLLDKINILNSKNKKDIAVIEDNLIRLQDVNKESIIKNEDNLIENTNKRKELGLQLEVRNEEFKSLSSLKDLFEEQDKKQRLFNDLSKNKSSFENRQKELNEYEICLINFKPLIETDKAISNKILKNNSELQETQIKSKQLESKLKLSKERFETVQKDYESIDKHKKQFEEYEKLITLKNLEKEIIQSSEKLENSQNDYKKALQDRKEVDTKFEALNSDIKKIEKTIPNVSLLIEIKEWFSTKQEITNLITALKNNVKTREKSLAGLQKNKELFISAEDKESLNIDLQKDTSDIITQLNSKLLKFEEGLKALQAERDELQIKEKLKDYSQSLRDGKECPVCGSTHHPNPIKVDNLDEKISQLVSRIKNGEEIIKKLRKYIEDFKLLQSKIESEQSNLSNDKKRIEEKNLELKAYDKSYKWKIYSPQSKEEINQALNEANKMAAQLVQMRSTQDSILNNIKNLQEILDINQANLSQAKDNLSSLMAKQNMLISQLEIIKFADFTRNSIDEIKNRASKLNLKIIKLEKDYRELTQEIKNLEIEKQKHKTRIESFDKLLAELNQEKAEISKRINIKLEEHKFSSISNINHILSKSIDIKLEKKEIENFIITYQTLKNEITKLKTLLKNKTFDLDIFNNLASNIADTKKNIEILDNEIGSLKNTISKLKLDLSEKEKYKKELKQKELREEDLKLMQSLFRGNGFVNYISTVRLQEVINYANSRFLKLTKGSLKLELGKKNTFNVIDFLNGGKQRSIKTLSGGQTFQASLSLALALAGIVQKQNKAKHNFFFLDEGFGTQDEESLQLVFNTIKSLRQENRIVGLISHVPELKEEINTYLEVINSEETGSKITKSWEM